MQKAKIKFFKDRAVFCTKFPIREQVEKGEWDFKLNPVYCVAILDFKFDDNREQKGHLPHDLLKDRYCRTFFDKLTYIFIEMPRFTKKIRELESHFDKWLFFLKHLENIKKIPDILKEKVFLKGFEIAEIAKFNQEEMAEYEESLMKYRDLKAVVDTSYEDGYEKGKKAGYEKAKVREIAKAMKIKGEPVEKIIKYTGLSKEEIEKL